MLAGMYTRDDLRRLRLDGLGSLLMLLYAGAVALTFAHDGAVWLGIALAALAVAAYFVGHYDPRLGGLLLVVGLSTAWMTSLFLLPGEATAYAGALLVGAVSALFGARTAGMAAAAIAVFVLLAPVELSFAVRTYAATLSCLAAYLYYLTARPIAGPLEWAWASYSDALAARDQLRLHQGELNGALKSLDIAYRRLEHLNDELARARHAAEQARRLKAEFAASISHELRTPLNLIVGFSEMMVATPQTYGIRGLPAAFQADVDAIHRNAEHLGGLIDDVLDLSQIEAGRMGLSRGPIDLAAVVEEGVRAVAPRLDDLGLRLDVQVPAALPRVTADRVRIRQILINLLNNAAKFTDRGGVTVAVRRDGNELIVSVADTGVGIPETELARVFDEFHQAHGAVARRVGGSGLGLTISRRLVELHGGAMWADSIEGVGSTFSFSLPLADQVVARGGVSSDLDAWDRRWRDAVEPTLAIVAADPAAARTLGRYLEGYRVEPVADLSTARALAAEMELSGVVVASGSRADSWQVLSAADDAGFDLPIAVCAAPTWSSRATDLGVADYLGKPVLKEDLQRVLGRLGRSVRSVLVVDDSPDMVRLLARTIRALGRRYQVRQATGGAEALAVMREHRPDVVLLDLLMPDVDGYAVIDAMRAEEQLREVPVVVISARGTAPDAPASGVIGVARAGGLSTGEMMGCLKACFDALSPRSPTRLGPAPPTDRAGSPASAAAPPRRGNEQAPLPAAPSR